MARITLLFALDCSRSLLGWEKVLLTYETIFNGAWLEIIFELSEKSLSSLRASVSYVPPMNRKVVCLSETAYSASRCLFCICSATPENRLAGTGGEALRSPLIRSVSVLSSQHAIRSDIIGSIIHWRREFILQPPPSTSCSLCWNWTTFALNWCSFRVY